MERGPRTATTIMAMPSAPTPARQATNANDWTPASYAKRDVTPSSPLTPATIAG